MQSLRVYSGFLTTLYDEPSPVGKIGDGAHYSIFAGNDHRFGVIWDRDHDPRIIHITERLLFAGRLRPLLFIGERQGHVFCILRPESEETATPALIETFGREIDGLSQSLDDPWRATVSLPGESQLGIIQDDDAIVAIYLQNICNLWNLAPNYSFDI